MPKNAASFSMFNSSVCLIHHWLIQAFLTWHFSLYFSESEVPILTTRQAPTVVKGVDIIKFLNFNSRFAICQFCYIWFNVSFALEPEATKEKPKKDTQKKGIVVICLDLVPIVKM